MLKSERKLTNIYDAPTRQVVAISSVLTKRFSFLRKKGLKCLHDFGKSSI